MLCRGNRIRLLFAFLLCIVNAAVMQSSERSSKLAPTVNVIDVVNIVKNLLNNIDNSDEWNEFISSALVFAEFLIKQKLKAHKGATQSGDNGVSYFEVLNKISSIRGKIMNSFDVHNLESLLEENLIFTETTLKENQIDRQLEHTSLLSNYASSKGTDFPSNTFSNLCLLHFHGREHCHRVRDKCLSAMKPHIPTFGYIRMHQVLQLFLLMHHSCVRQIGSQLYFEIVATDHCSQVYREHRAILALDSKKWQDLYIEQSAMCGLFGFTEFLNLVELQRILAWENNSMCNCIKQQRLVSPLRGYCKCVDHKHSVSLVFYVNAMLNL